MLNFKQDILKQNGTYYIVFFVFCFTSLGLTQYYGRDELHLLGNTYHNAFFDIFFKYFSKYSSIVLIISTLIFIYKKERYKTLFFFISAFLVNFLIGFAVKKAFFIHGHRPTFYFSERGVDLHLIEGVRSQIPFTFPSGHTSEFFLFALFFCLYSKSKLVHFACSILAITMAISRVYLSKHFLIDTVGGALLGVFTLTLVFYIYKDKNSTRFLKKIS